MRIGPRSMGRKTAQEEKSDGIEIISVGKLYTGPWDKKYWSSSRGKDRYPYPIGYKSLRTQHGVAYTMEIFEGPKGPAFVIGSTDGKSCSGDTPDIACESFQKKSFSKLCHGKRFASKIDGVEFFGFKNAYVQRLLREMVANIGGTAEEGLSLSNFQTGVSETVNHLQWKSSSHDSNFLSNLVKSRVKGKRSKSEIAVNSEGLSGTNFEQRQQEKRINNASSPYSKQIHQCGYDTLTSATTNEASEFKYSPDISRPENSVVIINDKKCPTLLERGLQMDSVDIADDRHRVGDSHTIEARNLTSSENLFGGFNVGSLIQNQKPVEGFSNILPENDGGATNVQPDLSTVHDADMCIPYTLDPAEGRFTTSPKNALQGHGVENDAIIKDVAKHEILVTDLCPEDEIFSSANYTSSQNCHIDSVGQEIDKSMMSVLLPQAVPLLKTFTRKKKKTGNASNFQTHKLQEENSMPKICLNGTTAVSGPVEQSDVGNVCTVSGGQDSSGHSNYVAPDSFDNDDPQCVLPYSDAPKAGTGIAGAKFILAADTNAASLKEITPNPKRARFDCQSFDKVPPAHASTIHGTSMLETIMCGKTSDTSMPKISKSRGSLELFAHYVHPKPISMVHLIVKENEVFLCVTCGYAERNESTIFLYNASTNREKIGCPSLIGHAPIASQISETNFVKDCAPYGSSLQLTPDARSLVLLNSIKTPYCREGKLHCLCPACASVCSKKNVVKIVRLSRGFASLVTRLQTSQGVCCLLVCGPTFLLAGEGGGKLKLWVMNSGWSAPQEDCHLPTLDCMFPSIVELKTIPNSSCLVVGHNGLGEFGLWDIERRILVSKFSSPGMSILGLVPISALSWRRKGECKIKALVDEIVNATKFSFSQRIENQMLSSDAAVWLLISTPSDPDSQSYHQSPERETNLQDGCWRLALLVNNTVITGSDVDQGAASVTPIGHGIIGRPDGLVYMWELSTGLRISNIHSFKGSKVSYLTTDASNFGALAIASELELLVYLPS